ncbi:MAG: lipoate protein ligase C-terminal domain-containing protein [Desulfobacterales bacterium]|nr:lipoate protein ligase C-terminal domain-containing protein [Desulfobacterales bacterium]
MKHRAHKATGGLMRADFEVKDGKFANISISGDLFCYPEDAIVRMERFIKGAAVDNISVILADFLNSHDIEIPVVNLGDWMKLMKM